METIVLVIPDARHTAASLAGLQPLQASPHAVQGSRGGRADRQQGEDMPHLQMRRAPPVLVASP